MPGLNNPDTCDICGEELTGSSHYHCGNCGVSSGMYGCYNGLIGEFACDPTDVEKWKARQKDEDDDE